MLSELCPNVFDFWDFIVHSHGRAITQLRRFENWLIVRDQGWAWATKLHSWPSHFEAKASGLVGSYCGPWKSSVFLRFCFEVHELAHKPPNFPNHFAKMWPFECLNGSCLRVRLSSHWLFVECPMFSWECCFSRADFFCSEKSQQAKELFFALRDDIPKTQTSQNSWGSQVQGFTTKFHTAGWTRYQHIITHGDFAIELWPSIWVQRQHQWHTIFQQWHFKLWFWQWGRRTSCWSRA